MKRTPNKRDYLHVPPKMIRGIPQWAQWCPSCKGDVIPINGVCPRDGGCVEPRKI